MVPGSRDRNRRQVIDLAPETPSDFADGNGFNHDGRAVRPEYYIRRNRLSRFFRHIGRDSIGRYTGCGVTYIGKDLKVIAALQTMETGRIIPDFHPTAETEFIDRTADKTHPSGLSGRKERSLNTAERDVL
jgi:hypothetical protein